MQNHPCHEGDNCHGNTEDGKKSDGKLPVARWPLLGMLEV
jgi:hypothetical protein